MNTRSNNREEELGRGLITLVGVIFFEILDVGGFFKKARNEKRLVSCLYYYITNRKKRESRRKEER